jgi:hypothetical protein
MKRAWLLAAIVGCGAKTGLEVPEPNRPDATTETFDAAAEVAPDVVPVIDAADAPFPCVVGEFPLAATRAELIILIDRSGSMGQRIGGERRWDTLHDALAITLPDFEARIDLGAMAYPRRFDGSVTRSCDLTRALDVVPAAGNAKAILRVLEGSDPWGATPTAPAVEFAGNWLAARVSRERTVAMVLATDGGPNCNVELDETKCVCTTPDSPCTRASACLDDARAVSTLASFAERGVPTVVIGLDSTALPVEREALVKMARAGGRPKAGDTPYYSANDPSAVQAAFRSIQEGIAECRLFMPSRPDDPDAVELRIDGVLITRDPKHSNGWDWGSIDFGQIDLFGPACDRARAAGAKAIARVNSCRD